MSSRMGRGVEGHAAVPEGAHAEWLPVGREAESRRERGWDKGPVVPLQDPLGSSGVPVRSRAGSAQAGIKPGRLILLLAQEDQA